MKFRRIRSIDKYLRTTESFVGQSLEEKVFKAVNSKAPIEAVAPMVYTERKEGVLPETNIRTDRFEIAQEAMTNIANGVRERRAKRMLEKSEGNKQETKGNKQETKTDKPNADSGNKTTTSVQE